MTCLRMYLFHKQSPSDRAPNTMGISKDTVRVRARQVIVQAPSQIIWNEKLVYKCDHPSTTRSIRIPINYSRKDFL
ncbi:hypothetical protein DFA_05623 [Cavenderia fasciculata]|uniref:Uncharacterized protein n=1 Tax=Cavenderia fasciculata TaxID=261658 RepID=F4PLR8_CACFS|nr:uncharacterized protein DFA_05623 [Cavenderia fasciculata]EGG23490.1 hypothetical protein DFA_05623 [Cavenderia fasciculata]|eukprot:XP_004361341.1 hypothetical protein DFA_05623 [Cavenderia fasciculata]